MATKGTTAALIEAAEKLWGAAVYCEPFLDRMGYRLLLSYFEDASRWNECEIDGEFAAVFDPTSQPQIDALRETLIDSKPCQAPYTPGALYGAVRESIRTLALCLPKQAQHLFQEELKRRIPELQSGQGAFLIRNVAHHAQLADAFHEAFVFACQSIQDVPAKLEPIQKEHRRQQAAMMMAPPAPAPAPVAKTKTPAWWIFPWPCPEKYLE